MIDSNNGRDFKALCDGARANGHDLSDVLNGETKINSSGRGTEDIDNVLREQDRFGRELVDRARRSNQKYGDSVDR